MTGRINYTPEADQQLDDLDQWITKAASPQVAQQFVRKVMDHVEGILVFSLAGEPRDDIRPGMRTTTCLGALVQEPRLRDQERRERRPWPEPCSSLGTRRLDAC